jgi:hypothetical protein
MNRSSKVLLFCLGALAVSQACADSEFGFRVYDKWYEYRITASQLDELPKWDPDKEDNPPLPAAKALAKARQFINTIETSPRVVWMFEDLSLTSVGKAKGDVTVWAWRARWQLASKEGPTTGLWPHMDCYILMDGTVLQPKVEKK